MDNNIFSDENALPTMGAIMDQQTNANKILEKTTIKKRACCTWKGVDGTNPEVFVRLPVPNILFDPNSYNPRSDSNWSTEYTAAMNKYNFNFDDEDFKAYNSACVKMIGTTEKPLRYDDLIRGGSNITKKKTYSNIYDCERKMAGYRRRKTKRYWNVSRRAYGKHELY